MSSEHATDNLDLTPYPSVLNLSTWKNHHRNSTIRKNALLTFRERIKNYKHLQLQCVNINEVNELPENIKKEMLSTRRSTIHKNQFKLIN